MEKYIIGALEGGVTKKPTAKAEKASGSNASGSVNPAVLVAILVAILAALFLLLNP